MYSTKEVMSTFLDVHERETRLSMTSYPLRPSQKTILYKYIHMIMYMHVSMKLYWRWQRCMAQFIFSHPTFPFDTPHICQPPDLPANTHSLTLRPLLHASAPPPENHHSSRALSKRPFVALCVQHDILFSLPALLLELALPNG